jgi:uncharacterized protein (TIRG00374 family)
MFTERGGLIFGIILLLVFFGVARHFSEGKQIWAVVEDAGWRWLFLGLILQAGTYFCYAATWHAALRRTQTPVKFRRLLPLSIAKLFMDQAAPSAGLGGALLVMESLAGKNIKRGAAVGALLVGLAGYYVAYAVLFAVALGIIAYFGTLPHWVILIAYVFGTVVSMLALTIILFWSGFILKTIPRRLREWERVKPFFDALEQVPEHFERDFTLLFEASIFSAGIFLLDAATLFVILKALHIPFGAFASLASFMLAAVAATIGMVPGGLGVFETSETAMLVFFGLSFESAFAATLILRGMTYWLPMLPGIFIVRKELGSRLKQQT